MKVLITTDWYYPVINGVVTSVQTLAAELKKRGNEVRILTLSRNHQSYKEGGVYYAGSVGAGRIYPQARLKLPVSGKCIKELILWKPDIIHSQCEFSTFLMAKKIAKELQIPIVHTYHTVYEDYTHYFSPRKKWGRALVQNLTRHLSGQVAGIIAPSEKIPTLLNGYQVDCPLWVVPSGIPLSRYHTGEDDSWRKQTREKYGISDDITVLIYVGRLAKEKNIGELIRYEEKAKSKKTILMLVGDGPYRADLENQVKSRKMEKEVIFTGMIPQKEVNRYYQAGDIFVSASTSETQGMTYGEALAAGLPLLCRKDDCLKGVVTDEKNGWQYENESGFLQVLERWNEKTEQEKQKMRSVAQESAALFSAEDFGYRMEQIYEQERERWMYAG